MLSSVEWNCGYYFQLIRLLSDCPMRSQEREPSALLNLWPKSTFSVYGSASPVWPCNFVPFFHNRVLFLDPSVIVLCIFYSNRSLRIFRGTGLRLIIPINQNGRNATALQHPPRLWPHQRTVIPPLVDAQAAHRRSVVSRSPFAKLSTSISPSVSAPDSSENAGYLLVRISVLFDSEVCLSVYVHGCLLRDSFRKD